MRTTATGLILALLLAPAWAQDDKPTSKPAAEPATVDRPQALIKTSLGDIKVELFADQAPETVKNFLDLAEGRKEFTDSKTGEKVKRPFYDGLTFHRVIKGFMAQGGCPEGNGRGGPGYKFKDEISAKSLGLDKQKAFTAQGQPHQYLGLRSREHFQQAIVMPLLSKLGIKSQEELQKRQAEVQQALQSLTLEEAFENMGYEYDDSLTSSKPVRGSLAMANAGPKTNGSQFFLNFVATPHLTGKHTVFGKVIEGMDVVDAMAKVETEGPASVPVKPLKILSIREIKSE